MSKLTEDQTGILERLALADQHYKQAKATEYQKAQRLADERVLSVKIDRDKLAAAAHAAGISLRKIANVGLHTQHTPTAKEAIEHGASLLPTPSERPLAPVAAPEPEAFTYKDGIVTVLLDEDDFTPYRKYLVQNPSTDDLRTFDFAVSADGAGLSPVNDADEATFQHPVVQVVTAPDGVWRERTLIFAREAMEKAA